LSDAPLTRCPACGEKKLSKLVSAAGFQLKGKGWYVTDFKEQSKPKPEDAKKSAEESKETKPAAPAAVPPASK
jgi:predicted nucleic acid-binding Zn ribbon protein